ncbi:MAG: recombinase family protein [Pseudomonadota bacterium]
MFRNTPTKVSRHSILLVMGKDKETPVRTGRVFGYARVSTEEQTLDQQVTALIAVGIPDERIERETISTRRPRRKRLEFSLKRLRPGDTLVVWKLDRIARSMKELLTIMEDLQDRGCGLRSLTEHIDTSTAAGRLLVNVLAALAQFERDIVSERTKAGMAEARRRGKQIGPKPKMTPQKIERAIAMRKKGASYKT